MKRLTASLLVLMLLLAGCAQPADAEEGPLYVHFIDVGQADCTLLKCGDTEILIDGGNTSDGAIVVNYLRQIGVEDIELVIATHPHEDHIGGIPAVLRAFPVEQVWTNTYFYDSYAYDNLFDRIDQLDIPLDHPEVGDQFAAGGIRLTVLGPLKTNYKDLNDSSIVVMAQFGQKRFLFTGDMEEMAELDLIKAVDDLKADVLKVGHHGSYSSTCRKFLEAVDPDFGVIHVGLNNEYGHPHDGPMLRLTQAEVAIYRTDLMGNIVTATDGNTIAFFQLPYVLPDAA